MCSRKLSVVSCQLSVDQGSGVRGQGSAGFSRRRSTRNPQSAFRILTVLVSAFVLILASLVLRPSSFVRIASAQAGQQMVINQIDGRGWPDINLNITLLGPDGKAIPNVDPSQFQVTESDQPQAITGLVLGPSKAVPLSVVLAIDISGSMAGDKITQAKAAAIAFLTSLGPNDRAALLSFNAKVTQVVPSTGDHGALEQGINSLQVGGNTAIYDALYDAAQLLNSAPAGTKRAIILLTDGADTSSHYGLRVAADVARGANALVYTIGVGPDANDSVLTSLAEPGGKYYKAPNPSDLKGIYSAISLELSSQLSLKYNSGTHVSRSYELITVQVKYTSKEGQVIVQTVRYRPSIAALIEPTPIVSNVPTPLAVPLPSGVGRIANLPDPPAFTANAVPAAITTITLLASMLVGLAVLAFIAAVIVRTSPSVAAQRLTSYTGPIHALADPSANPSPGFLSRALVPSIEGLGRRLARFSPKGYTENIQQLLVLAGPPYRMQVGGFLALQLVCGVLLFVPLLWWAVHTYPDTPAQWVLSGLLALVMGLYLPYFWLARRVRSRQRALLKALPGALDFLAINVEAGMGFDSAMTEVVRRWHNPLTDEFSLLLIDFQIGKPRKDAWRDLIQRTKVPDLTSFVTAMLQNEQVGSSIGQLLRVQAEHMRIRRRQRAEEAARVAPVKMLIPLVFFIFPGILIVLLGPAIPQILDVFGSGGP
jgi:tight adherence protein C